MEQYTRIWIILCAGAFLAACGSNPYEWEEQRHTVTNRTERTEEELSVDASTGIPFATTFTHPVKGFRTSDYGFGFGNTNQWFCMKTAPDGTCAAYGAHLGRDTRVDTTPVGTTVRAPADGIVRITTDVAFGGYGSDIKANPDYNGCVVVLEHLLSNGQAVTTLLGHVACGSGPSVGSLVKQGDPVAKVAHYWHGANQSTDWHHVHWAMRSGRFSAARYEKADLLPYVQGYAPSSEFTQDPTTGTLAHPLWLDPFAVIAANGDAEEQAQANVTYHPPGALLKDPDGTYWLVQDSRTIATVPPATARSDRYPTAHAIPISQQEVGCYAHAEDVVSHGPVTLYVRPGTNAVVMAYDLTKERYDVINWETFLSWGFAEEDIVTSGDVSFYESTYHDKGFRLLRPGTLVKAAESPEVSIVTPQQTRLPIASEAVFKRAGFQWNRIVSVPESVITEVAGPREDRVLTEADLEQCAVSEACSEGEACGGGGGWLEPAPEPEAASEPEAEPEAEPEPQPQVTEPEPEAAEEERPESVPESAPTEVVPPTATASVLTITVSTWVDMEEFSLWLLSGSLYATPEDTAVNCTVESRSAVCNVMISASRTLEFWMYTGVPNTPWSPGLNWETNACDPFADVGVTRGEEPISWRMEQVDDGCHFVIDGM